MQGPGRCPGSSGPISTYHAGSRRRIITCEEQ